MKTSAWRPALLRWLTAKLIIDSYFLDTPAIGQTYGFIPPLRAINYTLEDHNTVRCYGIQDIYATRRYPASMAYSELPIAELEGIHSTLSLRLAVGAEDIADITRLEVLSVEDPMVIEETGDTRGDWLVRLHWVFSITFYAEPEDGLLGKPFTIKSIDLGLYRERIDGAANILDYHNKIGL